MDDEAEAAAEQPAGGKVKKVHFRRTRRVLGKIPHPPLHSTRGIVLLVGGTALVVGGVVFGAMWFIPYSESVAFCTTCHTMVPQHKAYEASVHSDVACGECHVAPGLAGWVKAKLAGTQELKALILNNYPTPIPPIPHDEMPPPEVTCMKCHSLDRINTPGNPIKLILRPRYETDEANTMQMVAVAIRPTGLGTTRSAEVGTEDVDTSSGEQAVLDPRGVHWHVAQDVTTYATDEHRTAFPLVEYVNNEGQTESFISSKEIGLASNVAPDIDRLKAQLEPTKMDCLDCHNMVGHNIPDPSQVLDEALADGTVSPSLPFIKRDALQLLNRSYINDAAADRALDAFAPTYSELHPAAAAQYPTEIQQASDEVRRIFEVTSTPAMRTVWTSYPDNLGHQRSPGCFRCHDGNHVKVVDGAATDEVIPSTCSTCHTFPQVGESVTGLQMGVPPASHSEKLYVFNHKNQVESVDAAFAKTTSDTVTCSTCHQKSYCENCHNSGAVKVTHDEMLFNHAASVRASSMTACAYCHQPVYCATCHNDEIIDEMALAQGRLNSQSGAVPDGELAPDIGTDEEDAQEADAPQAAG